MKELIGYTIVAIVPKLRRGQIDSYWIAGYNDEDKQAVSAVVYDLTATRWDRGEYYLYETYKGGKEQAVARAISDTCNSAGQAGWLRPEQSLGVYVER